jgi:outer membrane protein assembly factor BamB
LTTNLEDDKPMTRFSGIFAAWLAASSCGLSGAENWTQYKYDSEHSGNAPAVRVADDIGLQAAIPLTDAVFTAPVIADGRIYVLDGAGVLFCVDAQTWKIVWQFRSPGGPRNCNNYSSPAIVGDFVHFGTMAGNYYVLNARDGRVVREIACGEPVFSCPVAGSDVVYFTTLGSQVYALSPEGDIRWTWDYVREVLQFQGDRWSGQDWLKHKGERVTWREQFLCSRNMALHGKTLVIPAGGSVVWLADRGDRAQMLGGFAPNESPSTLGLSMDPQGAVYRQWFRRDNGGRVEVLRIVDGKVETSFVAGTETDYQSDPSMSFSSVSIRGDAVYRCRPEAGFGLCRHEGGQTIPLGDYPAIAPPIIAGEHVLVGCLDGRLVAVPLEPDRTPYVFATPFGRPITAPPAVANGQIVFGGEDGYLYILGPGGHAAPPTQQLDLTRVRSPLASRLPDEQYDWATHYGNQANTNRTRQGLRLPLAMRWMRRCEGTIKHLSTIGGGRMYTHTAEGQVMAVEQETGRLLWRVYYPGVHVSFTTPAYYRERLYLPQAGLERSRLRCLRAATGELIWEVPFTGSPSWNRQLPPIIHNGLIFYQFSSGKYTGRDWLFEHQSTFGFPDDQRPIVKAWNLDTGAEVWSRDFSEYGHGGDDAGMCLAEGTLYYSCYFGNKPVSGVTAALEPDTGKIKWATTDYSVHAGCAPSIDRGRLYLGGYNAVEGNLNRVFCLDATNGQLIWKSDPLERAIHVVTVADDKLFAHAQYRQGYLLNSDNGAKICELTQGYRCTRFTMDGSLLLGSNMDLIDTSHDNQLISTGPAVDVLQCVGAHISNGRLFYTANGSGLQLSMSYGDEAEQSPQPWSGVNDPAREKTP